MRAPAIAALLLPATALASGDLVPHVTARDLAMAEATVAAQIGAPATLVNPAALARIEGVDVSVTGAALSITDRWATTTGLSPSPYQTDFKLAPPAAVFAAFGGKLGDRGVGVGLGFFTPAGGNVFWPDGWTGRFQVVEVDRRVYGGYLSAGAEVLPWLRLGAGLVYYRTTEDLKQAIAIPGGEGRVQVGTVGDAVTWGAAAEIGPFESVPVTLGVNYRHQAVQTLEGDVHFDIPPSLQTVFPDQKVTHVLTLPNKLDLGVAWRVTPPVLLVAGFTLDRYVVYKSDTFVGTVIDPTTGQLLQVAVQRNYRNGYTMRLGGEWQATERLAVRAGILRDHSGYRPEYYDPSLPDGNAWAAAAGLGWTLSPALAVHAAFFYAWFDRVTGTAQQPDGLPGNYDIDAWIAALGVTWRWSPTPK